MGLDYEGTHHTYLRTFDIPVSLEFLQEDNEIKVRVLRGGTYANVNLIVWEMSRDAPRSQEGNRDSPVAVTSVTVPVDALKVGIKQSIAVNATVSPDNASNQTLDWTSDNPRVAVVDANGIVTGIGKGTTRINGVTRDGAFEVSTSVTVTDVAPAGVRILYGDAEVIVCGTRQLFAYVDPWLATSKEVTWTSGNSAIARVDGRGIVTGVNPGSTAVTAKTVEGGFEANVKIRVSTLHVKDVSITPEFAVLPKGDSIQMTATWTPANASNRTAKWNSRDSSIATVDEIGRVIALRAGKAKISAVSADGGFTDSATIDVSKADAEPFFVEAENFASTGGTFQGFKVTEDERHTNYNQTGDWADYKVQVPDAGTYQVLLDARTPLDGAGVEILINGKTAGSQSVPNTGNWSTIQRTTLTNALSIPKAGKYTIRLLSVASPTRGNGMPTRSAFAN